MKKQILNLGKALNKTEQKSINGGRAKCEFRGRCRYPEDCWHAAGCVGSVNDYLCIDGNCAFNPNP